MTRVIAITGASAGIGRATALRLARDGAKLVICARRGELLDQAAAEIAAAGGDAMPIVADVTHADDMQMLADRLVEEDFPCYGLTNWSGETYRMAQDQMGFVQHMKYTAVSGDLKLGKPEPEIFLHLLDVIGKPAAATAFIDDSPKNIDAAKKLGINAVLFKNDGSATAELRRLGLPV